MTGPGPLVVKPVVSVTAPSALRATVSAALTPIFNRVSMVDVIALPSARMIMFTDGISLPFHLLDGVQYLTGPLAPYTAPTLASTSARATATIVSGNGATTDFANNDALSIKGADGVTYTVNFKTTLTAAGGTNNYEVKRGTSLSNSNENFRKMINGTGTDGVEYAIFSAFGVKAANSYLYEVARLEVPAAATGTTTMTATLRARDYGTVGNGYGLTELVDGGATWSVTGWTGGSAGTGTDPQAGTYAYAYAYVRKGDGAQTAVSNESQLTQSSNANVTVSAFDTAPTRDGMDLYRVFRTTDTGAELFKSVDGAASPLTDTASDDTLEADGNVVYDPDSVRSYLGGYPTKATYHAPHLGSVMKIGADIAARQTQGKASVTVGSRTVTLTTLIVKQPLIGRTFRVTTSDVRYGINDIAEGAVGAGTITLNRPYEGGTDATADYEIVDDRDSTLITWSEPLLPNNSPFENSLEGVYSNDPRGGTGIRSMWGTAVVFTRTGTWRVLGNPQSGFRIIPQTEASGAWCNKAVVEIGGADGGSLAWIGPDGVQLWGGSGDPTNISKPRPGDGDSEGIAGTIQRVNPLAARGICGVYNPSSKVVRWAVPVDGSMWNNLIIQLNLQTGRFTFQNCDAFTDMRAVVGPSGSYITVAGDMYGKLWQLDSGYSEGAYGFECVQTITAYSTSTNKLTVAGTPLPTTSGGLAGTPAVLISSDGTRQRMTVAANTSSTATLVGPPDTTPLVGSQVIFGALPFRILTSKFSLGMPANRKTVSSVTVHYKVSTGGQLWCAASVENADPTCFYLSSGGVDYADLTATRGTKYFEIRRGPGRTVQLEFFALTPGFDLSIIGIEVVFRTRDEVLQ